MMTCRFELRIRGSGFHCAAKFGADGWAWVWFHGKFRDPCVECPIKIDGKPLIVRHELSPADFMHTAGKRIRRCDWIEIKKRGYTIKRSGIVKLEED